MKIRVLLILIFSIYPSFAFSFQEKTLECSDWNLYSEHGEEAKIFKVFFVRGIYEGLTWGESPILNDYSNNDDYESLVSKVDSFCLSESNANIGIDKIILIESLKSTGADKKLIEWAMTLSRESKNFLLRDIE